MEENNEGNASSTFWSDHRFIFHRCVGLLGVSPEVGVDTSQFRFFFFLEEDTLRFAWFFRGSGTLVKKRVSTQFPPFFLIVPITPLLIVGFHIESSFARVAGKASPEQILWEKLSGLTGPSYLESTVFLLGQWGNCINWPRVTVSYEKVFHLILRFERFA